MTPPINRHPLIRCVPRGAARPYHVLAHAAVDVDGKHWPASTVVVPGSVIQEPGQPDIQLVTVRGKLVRFAVESADAARDRMRARWEADGQLQWCRCGHPSRIHLVPDGRGPHRACFVLGCACEAFEQQQD